MNLDLLSKPFPAESIHWRAQTVTRNGDKALALAYVDARDVMDHLDRVVGPENWQDSYTETAKGRVICTIKLRIGDEWVGKSDGAGDTAVEGEKGGISDAFKRAAVKWGIARYLYDLGNVWAPCESRDNGNRKQFVKWLPAADKVFADALRKFGNSSAPAAEKRPSGPINEKTQSWIEAQVQTTGKPMGDFLKAMEVTSTKALTYEKMDDAVAWVHDNRRAA